MYQAETQNFDFPLGVHKERQPCILVLKRISLLARIQLFYMPYLDFPDFLDWLYCNIAVLDVILFYRATYVGTYLHG